MTRSGFISLTFSRLGLSRRRTDRHGNPVSLSEESAVSRTEAYIYGNILVLAALATLVPDSVPTGAGALLVLGTAVSTFVAHVLAHIIGHQVRSPGPDGAEHGRHHVRQSIRDAVPIVTSGALPAIVLLLGLIPTVSSTWVLVIADGLIVIRFLLFGTVLGSLSGRKSGWGTLGTGFALAAAGVIVAAFKIVLTH